MTIQIPAPERVPVNKVRIDDTNPNKLPDAKLAALKENIKKYGFLIPIITNQDLLIADGEHRLRAARELGMTEVPVIKLPIKEVDRRMIRQVMNKLRGEHDELKDDDEYRYLLDHDSFDEFKKLLALTDREEVRFLAKLKNVEDDDFDPANSLKKPKYSVKSGDLWALGRHRLLCGDATKKSDYTALMGPHKADMVFTDPPYSVNYEKKATTILKSRDYSKITNDEKSTPEVAKNLWKPSYDLMAHYSHDHASIYSTMPQGGDQMMMMMMMMDSWKIKHELIWAKPSPVFSMGRLDYDYMHEPIAYGWKKNHRFYGAGEHTKSIWPISRDSDKSHPTMKPVALMANAIKNSTLEQQTILDPFGGSGSTLIAAHQLNRTCHMLEIDPTYCSVIIERWEKLTQQKAKKL